ncbi:MAG: lysozyme [Sphingomonadales bacterium]|jgi:GH24 family phage-related lysozyme (muramidase)|nr:lysozyme [Sphingomonadales bacterium]
MTAPRISLTIDRLVLHGVDRADAAAVRRALTAELCTRLAGADIDGEGVGDRLRLVVATPANPAALGGSAGASIARALAGNKAGAAASPASAKVQRQPVRLLEGSPADVGTGPASSLDDLLTRDDDPILVRQPSGDQPAVFRRRRPSPLLPSAPTGLLPEAPPAPIAASTPEPASAAPPTPAPTGLSAAGIAFVQRKEGFHTILPNGRIAAYPERIGGSVIWTIGWGSTGRDIGPDTVWTRAQCEQRFARQVAFFERGVAQRLRGIPTTQNEFDALVSLAYNAGLGQVDDTEVFRRHIAGDREGAARAFQTTLIRAGRNRAVSTGLIRRREAESRLYLGIEPPASEPGSSRPSRPNRPRRTP